MWGVRIMISASDYLQLAKECILEAERIQDEDRKKTLLDIAKLYNLTALYMENVAAQDNRPPLARLANVLRHSLGS
jgi:hypothetical protein